ncbi:hypothetical protein P9B58_18185 [Bacillus mojavensis]|nr:MULTISPECIES: hypothetical protein [Bacillus subtilis group]MCO4853115.1 hypothetical protein [Bacillus vallismortis]MEC1292092.1 hypothetical protein [Bacillus mojavensis]MEC1634798.1 hypothetical protein [Bacillus mojavensis]MEC1653244.1 hypothetical protein [Bacillus vallismortis]MEC1705045.1 hypothetical protein [Bacillus mojavensis]
MKFKLLCSLAIALSVLVMSGQAVDQNDKSTAQTERHGDFEVASRLAT